MQARAKSHGASWARSGAVTPTIDNPFDSELARRNSRYYGTKGGRAVLLSEPGGSPDLFASAAVGAFRGFVLNPEFSCVGAKSAVMHETYRLGVYDHLGGAGSTAGLCRDLYTFAREADRAAEGEFMTFVAMFREPTAVDEREFERLLWVQLRLLNQLDAPLHEWDPSVSEDPEDSHFGFSFAETAFFIVGLHPHSSREARRFIWPTLVFNPHAQFQHLKDEGRWARLQEVDPDARGDTCKVRSTQTWPITGSPPRPGNIPAGRSSPTGIPRSPRSRGHARASVRASACPFLSRHAPIEGGRGMSGATGDRESAAWPAADRRGIPPRKGANTSAWSTRTGSRSPTSSPSPATTSGSGSLRAGSLDYANTIYLTTGHVLYSNRSRPMFTILADDVGRHDFLLTPCSIETFRIIYNHQGDHPSCFGNLAEEPRPVRDRA